MPSSKDVKFSALMSLVTTFFVTFVLVSINVGFNEFFIYIWMRSWLIAFVLVGLSILYLAPVIKSYLNKP
ncbi:MAG: DUF2798 domain-containing protein [Bacteroidota bacterium]